MIENGILGAAIAINLAGFAINLLYARRMRQMTAALTAMTIGARQLMEQLEAQLVEE